MNGMCGINRRVGPPFQGWALFGGVVPRALPWAGMMRPVEAVAIHANGAQNLFGGVVFNASPWAEAAPPVALKSSPKGACRESPRQRPGYNKARKGRSTTTNAIIRSHEQAH